MFRLGIHADRERYQAFDFGLVGPISTSCKFEGPFLGAHVVSFANQLAGGL